MRTGGRYFLLCIRTDAGAFAQVAIGEVMVPLLDLPHQARNVRLAPLRRSRTPLLPRQRLCDGFHIVRYECAT